MTYEWNHSTINDVCVLVTDGSHSSPKSVNDGKYMVSVKDFTDYGFDFASCRMISNDDYETLKRNGCVPQIDDILIGKDGARFFEDIIIYRQREKPALLSSIAILRCDKSKILPDFLYYVLRTPSFRQDVKDNYGSGSAIPRIILKDFKRMMVSYPSLEKQQAIISVLTAIDSKIQANTEINDNLYAQAKAIFDNHFINIDAIPAGWRKGNLLDIANYLNGLAMQKFRPQGNEIGLPVLKIKELRQGSCDDSSELCSLRIKPEYIIHDGDVIFSWSGSLLVDIWCGGTCGLNQHLFKVTSDIYDKWFYYLWTAHHLARFIAIAADKATTMGHIKREELAKAEVLIPCEEDYTSLTSIMQPIFELIISNRIEARKLAALRDELLPKLMSGEIDVSAIQL
ncbi:restriction endonuclease subunit S [Flavonifractor plautii]|jgi:type I restriction enzyme S subunit|uniref:restriction endonuclease subunit S n=1 Tax=Flavonifractor plautii TaxID=292800 RepID=UPI000E43F784|nr:MULTISPECIES: restriction endonuclease subunit S [Eubacteriales]MCB7041984.1 restriction endonuclease subunit S [Flavonifractor plautii]RGM80472.1 restriction endonuclease subunit S [Butyricicoccus sp. OM06-6AC]RJV83887.1 restriction endonuclease subunit S [Eubacterium sp. AF18-3]